MAIEGEDTKKKPGQTAAQQTIDMEIKFCTDSPDTITFGKSSATQQSLGCNLWTARELLRITRIGLERRGDIKPKDTPLSAGHHAERDFVYRVSLCSSFVDLH